MDSMGDFFENTTMVSMRDLGKFYSAGHRLRTRFGKSNINFEPGAIWT